MFKSYGEMKKAFSEAVESGILPHMFWAGAMSSCIQATTNRDNITDITLAINLAYLAAVNYDLEIAKLEPNKHRSTP